MKKGMSKFLSIVLSAAMVSPMIDMNFANAMVSSEDAADSTSTTEPANATETTNATEPTSAAEPANELGNSSAAYSICEMSRRKRAEEAKSKVTPPSKSEKEAISRKNLASSETKYTLGEFYHPTKVRYSKKTFKKEKIKKKILIFFRNGEKILDSIEGELKVEDILSAKNEFRTKKIAAIVIYKLIKFMGKYWNQGEEGFIEEISSYLDGQNMIDMNRAFEKDPCCETTIDSETNLIYSLSIMLAIFKIIPFKDPGKVPAKNPFYLQNCQYINKQFHLFCLNFQSIAVIIRTVLVSGPCDKTGFAGRIVDIIKKMDDFLDEDYCNWMHAYAKIWIWG